MPVEPEQEATATASPRLSGLDSRTAALFAELPARTTWQSVAEIELDFETYHPQGLTKIGDIFYLTSVKVIEPTKMFGRKIGGYDRSTGSGEGYLFKFDGKGHLLQRVQLGEGAIYHPGGMGHDGRWLWVPVAEYRPDSSSIVYRVDPGDLDAAAVLRVDDHIGDVVRDLKSGTLNGVSWGSRRAYTWKIDEGTGNVVDPPAAPGSIARPRGIRDIDYQDCQYVGGVHAICGGLTSQSGWGGLDLVDLGASEAVHQVPVPMKSPKTGKVLTNNPVFAEVTEDHLRFYFAPDDNGTTLFVYDAFAK